jgi:hypothetical protein
VTNRQLTGIIERIERDIDSNRKYVFDNLNAHVRDMRGIEMLKREKR